MNLTKTTALAAALIALAGCQKGAENTAADEATVREAAPGFEKVMNEGDAQKLAAMYWDDAVLMPPGSPAVNGSGPIGEFLGKEGAGMKSAGLTMNLDDNTSVDVAGDLAYEAGTYSVTDASGSVVDKGKFLGVLQKRNGKWLYVRDTWNSDQPPAAAAPAPAVEAPPAG